MNLCLQESIFQLIMGITSSSSMFFSGPLLTDCIFELHFYILNYCILTQQHADIVNSCKLHFSNIEFFKYINIQLQILFHSYLNKDIFSSVFIT